MLYNYIIHIVISYDSEEMKIAYPTLMFDGNIIDGRGMMCSLLTPAIGNNPGHFVALHMKGRDVERRSLFARALHMLSFVFEAWSTARSLTSTCLLRSSASMVDLPSTWRTCGASWAVARGKAPSSPRVCSPSLPARPATPSGRGRRC